MELDPDIHIVMHLVLSLKPGVTLVLARNWPRVCHLDYACSFLAILVQIHLHTFLDLHLWNPLDNDPILMLSH
jgi:hypothetical protein